MLSYFLISSSLCFDGFLRNGKLPPRYWDIHGWTRNDTYSVERGHQSRIEVRGFIRWGKWLRVAAVNDLRWVVESAVRSIGHGRRAVQIVARTVVLEIPLIMSETRRGFTKIDRAVAPAAGNSRIMITKSPWFGYYVPVAIQSLDYKNVLSLTNTNDPHERYQKTEQNLLCNPPQIDSLLQITLLNSQQATGIFFSQNSAWFSFSSKFINATQQIRTDQ